MGKMGLKMFTSTSFCIYLDNQLPKRKNDKRQKTNIPKRKYLQGYTQLFCLKELKFNH